MYSAPQHQLQQPMSASFQMSTDSGMQPMSERPFSEQFGGDTQPMDESQGSQLAQGDMATYSTPNADLPSGYDPQSAYDQQASNGLGLDFGQAPDGTDQSTMNTDADNFFPSYD